MHIHFPLVLDFLYFGASWQNEWNKTPRNKRHSASVWPLGTLVRWYFSSSILYCTAYSQPIIQHLMFYIKRLMGFRAPFRTLNVLISCVAPAAIPSIQCFSKKKKKNIFQKFNNNNNTWSKLQFTTVILNFQTDGILHYHLPLLPSPFPTICNIQYHTYIIILDSCHTLYFYFSFDFLFVLSVLRKIRNLFPNISMSFSKFILSLEMPLDFLFWGFLLEWLVFGCSLLQYSMYMHLCDCVCTIR